MQQFVFGKKFQNTFKEGKKPKEEQEDVCKIMMHSFLKIFVKWVICVQYL